MAKDKPVLELPDALAVEIANYIKAAKAQPDMAGYIAIAQLIIERVENERMAT